MNEDKDYLLVGSPRPGGLGLAAAIEVVSRGAKVHYTAGHPGIFQRFWDETDTSKPHFSPLERQFLEEQGITSKNDLIPCDVTRPDQIRSCFQHIRGQGVTIDGMMYAPAYAAPSLFTLKLEDIPAKDLERAQDISCDGLFRMLEIGEEECAWGVCPGSVFYVYRGKGKMAEGYGAMDGIKKKLVQRVHEWILSHPHNGGYPMRLNGIDCAPIKTVSSSAIPGIDEAIKEVHEKAPIGWPLDDVDEVRETLISVGKATCLFLDEPMCTGQILTIDGGYNLVA